MHFLAINIFLIILLTSLHSCTKPTPNERKTATIKNSNDARENRDIKQESGNSNEGKSSSIDGSDDEPDSDEDQSKGSSSENTQIPGENKSEENNEKKVEEEVLQARNTCNDTDSIDYTTLKPESIQEGINAYSFYCSSCHSPIFESEKIGRCASNIAGAYETVPMANIANKPSPEKIKLISAALNSQSTLSAIQSQNLVPSDCSKAYTETEIADIIAMAKQDPSYDADTQIFVSSNSLYADYVNAIGSPDEQDRAEDLVACRFGLAKALNSQTRVTSDLKMPIAIDKCNQIFKVDLKDYWEKEIFLESTNPDKWGLRVNLERTKAIKRELFKKFDDVCEYSTGVQRTEQAGGQIGLGPNLITGTYYHLKKGFHVGNDGILDSNGQRQDVVECSQFVYTLTLPAMYAYTTQIPDISTDLQSQVGFKNIEGDIPSKEIEIIAMTESENAITFTPRISFCKEIKPGSQYIDMSRSYLGDIENKQGGAEFNYYCHSTELGERVEQEIGLKYNPQPTFKFGAYFLPRMELVPGQETTGNHTPAGEVIYSFPNGMQGYMLTGNASDRRDLAPFGVVRDPNRTMNPWLENDGSITYRRHNNENGGLLITGRSCAFCHVGGLNRSYNDMLKYLDSFKGNQNVPLFCDQRDAACETMISKYEELYGPQKNHNDFYDKANKQFREKLKLMFAAMNPYFSEEMVIQYYNKEPLFHTIKKAREKYVDNVMPEGASSYSPFWERKFTDLSSPQSWDRFYVGNEAERDCSFAENQGTGCRAIIYALPQRCQDMIPQ